MEVYWKGIPRSQLSVLCLVGRAVDGSWGPDQGDAESLDESKDEHGT